MLLSQYGRLVAKRRDELPVELKLGTCHDGEAFIVDAVVVDGRLEKVGVFFEPFCDIRNSVDCSH